MCIPLFRHGAISDIFFTNDSREPNVTKAKFDPSMTPANATTKLTYERGGNADLELVPSCAV